MSRTDDRTRDQAFEAFYGRTSPGLWGYLYRMCGNGALADDIVQETFIRYLHNVQESLPERQRKAFIYKIASHLLVDDIRARRTVSLEAVEERAKASGPAPSEALSPDLRRLFESLPPRDRSLLWLAYIEGYDHIEIAEILGLKAGSIKVILFRLRRSFAVSLKEIGYIPEESS
ncbi:MAG: sigma-70 family RNA polymerase sigma factor [Candidatus Aminicenantes bacterium]|nr:sigma-70 family RNA polymerase sigma factor [Candidatus Aminicenantes bacterium]